ncbi:MAG TPA: hypothetical protein VIJ85_00135 [Rhizomicrobium sp.]
MADENGKQDFTLVNRTGYTISEVYVSPSRANDWQEDVLGDGTLGTARQIAIHFHRHQHPCHWDLKVVYEDDNSSAEWSQIDLCSVSEVTIRYNRDTDVTSASYR